MNIGPRIEKKYLEETAELNGHFSTREYTTFPLRSGLRFCEKLRIEAATTTNPYEKWQIREILDDLQF